MPSVGSRSQGEAPASACPPWPPFTRTLHRTEPGPSRLCATPSAPTAPRGCSQSYTRRIPLGRVQNTASALLAAARTSGQPCTVRTPNVTHLERNWPVARRVGVTNTTAWKRRRLTSSHPLRRTVKTRSCLRISPSPARRNATDRPLRHLTRLLTAPPLPSCGKAGRTPLRNRSRVLTRPVIDCIAGGQRNHGGEFTLTLDTTEGDRTVSYLRVAAGTSAVGVLTDT